MSNPVSILGSDLTGPGGRQNLQDALDTLYGLIQASKGSGASGAGGASLTTIDELRVRKLTVTDTIDVVPQDKPPANEAARQIVPWLTGQRGRGFVMRYDDQGDGGDKLEWRFQPYLIGSPTATTGDWELRAYTAQRDEAGAFRSQGALVISEDGRLRLFNASEVEIFDSDDYSATPAFPKRFVEGLVIRYASSSTITVSAGKARDKADGANMTLASQVTVSTATVNAALGYERKTLTGTATWTLASATVTGSGTAFLTEFGTRALTVGTITNAGATLTGTSTKFLSEVAVNDLIGNATSGYYQVTAIASDTSLTLATYPSAVGKTDFSGSSANVIEQPLIESAGGKRHPLYAIASDTSLTITNVALSTETGVACYATAGVRSPAEAGWRAVWLASGGSGTTVFLSTQRTTPYGSITGYTTSYRRIGWVRLDSSGNLVYQASEDAGPTRFVAVASTLIITNADSTSTAVDVSAAAVAPPTTTMLYATLQSEAPNTVRSVAVGARGGGGGDLLVAAPSTSLGCFNTGVLNCDRAQVVFHQAPGGSTTDGTYLYISGYWDVLE